MLEDIIGIFSAHFQTAEFVKVEWERHFDQTRMDQKAHITPDLARHEFKGHDAIERHKAAMRPHHYCPPLTWNVFAPFDFNTPVVVVKEIEDSAPFCLDIVEVHTEVVKVRTLRWVAPELLAWPFRASNSASALERSGVKPSSRLIFALDTVHE